jgi:hypothetical protein
MGCGSELLGETLYPKTKIQPSDFYYQSQGINGIHFGLSPSTDVDDGMPYMGTTGSRYRLPKSPHQ